MLYTQEFITLRTEDNLELDGLLAKPLGNESTGGSQTLVVLVHGLAMNFYNPFFMQIVSGLTESGYSVLSANNRGHDLHTTRRAFNEKNQGAMWETFPGAALDLKAAVDFGHSSGYERMVLAGHSLGALKVVFYQSKAREPMISGLVLISPVRSMVAVYKYRMGQGFDHVLQVARANAQQGKGENLVPIDPAWPFVLSSKTVVSFAGEANEADIYPHVEKINIPILVILDDTEKNPELGQSVPNPTSVRTDRVKGADHFYNGYESAVTHLMLDWLSRI